MNKLSGVVITYNEENNIERCLKSMVGIVDEIVIVDSFSNDKTEEIAAKFGANFIKHKFEGYRDQKNFAMNQAKYEYVLSLDADEELSEDLRKIIYSVKNIGFSADAYTFNRKNRIGERWVRHGDMYPDRKIRLWNRTKGKWTGGNVHEIVQMDQDCSVAYLKADLLHFAFRDIVTYNAQQVKYAELWAKEKFENGRKSGSFKIYYKSSFKFFKSFFLKFGFLDGFYGYVVAKTLAYYTFLKYSHLKELNSAKDKK